MKLKIWLIFFFLLLFQTLLACPVCEKQQPKLTQGLTHGIGPESNWDWLIIALIVSITLLTFVFSLKYLIMPNEKEKNHIKKSILINN